MVKDNAQVTADKAAKEAEAAAAKNAEKAPAPGMEGDPPQKQPVETEAMTTQEDADKAADEAQAGSDGSDEDSGESDKSSKSEKTKTYFVRSVRGFFTQPHRRAGYSFDATPEVQELQLTKEQHDLIDSDPGLEFVSKGDASKITDAQATIDGVEGDNPAANGRVYE